MKNNIYDGLLQFRGTWRTYQERVLANSQKYLEDGKVHIVAAPGSGKTTLGIELIRRLGAPALILSPSITIRQQWLERIEDGFFVKGAEPEEFLSNDLKAMKSITAITYQALYSAMKHYQGELAEEDGDAAEDGEGAGARETESVDFRDFDLFEAVKAAGVRVVCLDEAHHLRSEWWKALEAFLKEAKGMTLISLTATPPYDSTPAQWKRYIDLCGPIDEEIFTPELVREKSLCPHEDYVYFNWPAKEELEEIQAYQENTAKVWDALLRGEAFTRMIATHRGLREPEQYSEKFLDNPKYFSALLIFCQAQGIPLPPYLKRLIGTKGRLPKLEPVWLEALLQGFLFDDADSYQVPEESREELVRELKKAGCIYRGRVSLTQQDALQKLLAKSRGKLESIEKIVDMEMQAQGGALRLLILCDFIKKDKLSLVGTDKPVAAEIGAVPIFEHLRRGQRQGIRLGLLSGSVIIVPLDTEDKLRSILEEKNCEGTLKPIAGTEYGRFQMKGKSTHVTAAVTELFRQGDVNVLIGTKSLLGEGWDAPCTNALILATYVGSFMLSNQMRGRTIRTDPRQPEKTGNIWHLACIFPLKSGKTRHADFSGDYETLTRRFDSFLGVSWKDPVIESGLGRLNIPEFDSREQMEEVNRMMLFRASDREGLRQRWQEALSVIHGEMEIEQAQAVPREELQTSYLFIHALGMEILNLLLTILLSMGRAFLRAGGSAALQVHLLGILILFTAFLAARYAVRLFRFGTPARRMKHIGDAVLGALLELGEIEEAGHCRTEVESAEGLLIEISLKGGTMRDKTAFAACMRELWGIIDNPRYLLARGGRKAKEFYAVPETFGKQKERALVFEKHVRRAMGRFRLVYTRTPEGRQILLRARTRSFVNKNQRVLTGKKVAKGKYE